MKHIRKAWTALTVGTLIAAVAACGGSEGGGLSDAPRSAPQAGASGAAEMTTLKMVETPGGPMSFVSYGVQQGYFADEGIDLQVRPNPGGGTSNVPGLINGEFDVSGLDIPSVLISVGRGLPLKIIAAGSSTAGKPELDFAGVLVKKDSPIQSSKDFAGITMGVNALRNINEVAIRPELEKQGIDPKNISFVELPFPEILAAVGRGDVDAGLVIDPFVTIGQAQGLRVVHRPWVALKPNLQIGAMIMTEKKIAEDPAVAEAFARAVRKTAEAIQEDPDAFRAELPKLTKLTPELAQKVNLIQWQGKTDPESVKLIGATMKKYGLLEGDIDYDALILN